MGAKDAFLRTICNWSAMSGLSRRLLIAAACAALAASCAPQAAEESAAFVNVYSARHYDADRAVYDAFTRSTGIEVRVLPAPPDQLIERMRVEGDQTEADLIVTADAGNLWRMQEAGLLQRVTTPALEAAVPDRLKDDQRLWWAFTRRARVIAYAKGAVLPQDVASFDALALPRFRGQVCARSSTNMYNLSMLASRIERQGADAARAWAQGVRANLARDPQGGDMDQLRAIAAGECQVAITNHYYYLRLAQSEDPAERAVADRIALAFPDQGEGQAGAHVNISGAGVTAHAQRRDNAVRLLEFLVSPEAQEIFAADNSEFPISDATPLTPALQALGTFREEAVPISALGRHQVEAARIYEEVGWR
ncbi:MAG: extracellular solute-binding protein [Alphaproteobacteria bacterium]|nr:extracellular solute-binding protein [Alphaproteobacteria bacterium]